MSTKSNPGTGRQASGSKISDGESATGRDPSAVSRNVHRVLAGPGDVSRRCRPREGARYEHRAAPSETPPGPPEHPGNVPGHRTDMEVGLSRGQGGAVPMTVVVG